MHPVVTGILSDLTSLAFDHPQSTYKAAVLHLSIYLVPIPWPDTGYPVYGYIITAHVATGTVMPSITTKWRHERREGGAY